MNGRLARMEQQFKECNQSEIEMDKVKEDLLRRVHDQQVAREILRIPFNDWRDWGGIFEKPFGEGSSKSKPESECVFRLYFKGLVREEKVRGETIKLAGIGVAICDPKDNLIFEARKPMPGNGLNKIYADAKALIEGLNTATALELKRAVDIFAAFSTSIDNRLTIRKDIARLWAVPPTELVEFPCFAGETNKKSLEALVKNIGKESLQWGLAFPNFVPSEKAFERDLRLRANDRSNGTYAVVSRILGFSAIPRTLTSVDVPFGKEMYDSISGFVLDISEDIDGMLVVNRVRSERVDLRKKQIVVHVMDGALMDAKFEESLQPDDDNEQN